MHACVLALVILRYWTLYSFFHILIGYLIISSDSTFIHVFYLFRDGESTDFGSNPMPCDIFHVLLVTVTILVLLWSHFKHASYMVCTFLCFPNVLLGSNGINKTYQTRSTTKEWQNLVIVFFLNHVVVKVLSFWDIFGSAYVHLD